MCWDAENRKGSKAKGVSSGVDEGIAHKQVKQ